MKSALGFIDRNFRSELEVYVRGTVLGKSIFTASLMTLAQVAIGYLLGIHRPVNFFLFLFAGFAVCWVPFVLAMRAIARKLGIVRPGQAEPNV